MTVSALITRNDITATASQTVFIYTFRVIEATDMAVYQNGVLLSSGYTVTGVNNTTGGTVVLDTGVPAGQIVSLVLAMPLDRTTNYQNSGKFLADDVNEDFDKIYIGAIQNENLNDRSLRLKDVEPPTTGVDMTIPLKADRLGKYLSFNSVTGAPEVVAGTGGSVTDASLVNYTPAGTGAVVTTVQAKLRESISVTDFGAVGDGIADDTAAIQAAIVQAKASGETVYIPFGKYLVTSTLDFYRVSVRGENASNQNVFAKVTNWPIIKGGPALTNIIRVGQETDTGSSVSDSTIVENLMIDMSLSPNNTKGMYCEHGLNEKIIKNIYIRAPNETTTAAIVAKNHTAFHFALSNTATQGLYYLELDNLISFFCFRGFYTAGHSNDGMRVSTIGKILSWLSPQAITFKDSENNSIAVLGVQSFLSDYDPSGQSPTEWGIWMDNTGNNVNVIYIEGINDATAPHTFMTAQHTFGLYRDLDIVPNSIQIILDDGTRIGGQKGGNDRSLVVSNELVEVGTIAGVQVQQPVNVNSMFEFWQGGSVNIPDNTEFAYSWKSVKNGTGTLRVTQRTGSSTTETYNSGVNLEITSPQADTLYGIKQDLVDYYPLSGTLLETIGRSLEYVTICVLVQPYNSNPSAMRFRIETDTGVATTSENYSIAYDPTTSGVDEKIIGQTGDFISLIHHVNLGNITKLEIKAGIYSTNTLTYGCNIDSIVVIAGRHTQYGARPYIHAPKYLKVPESNPNTNTPSGATAQAIPIFNYDGSLMGYLPVYAAEW